MLTPTATIAYVDAQLVIKAHQSTTYTNTEVDNKLTLKLDSSALTDYYNKSYVDTALAGKQPLINMLTYLSVATITASGAITAAGFFFNNRNS